jgi:hypothetical protein
MRVLSDGSWADLLTPEHFVKMILIALLESWKTLPAPEGSSDENPVNRQLCAALRDYSAHANLPFHVDSQWEILDEQGNVVGVPDIRFTPNVTRTGEDFYVVECKRLRYHDKDRCRSANSAYIDGQGQGMTAFIDQRYPTPQGYGGMIGYVLCSCEDPVGKVRKAMNKRRDRLGLKEGEPLRPSSFGISGVFETEHHVGPSSVVVLHHVFLDSSDCVGRRF